MFAIGLQGCTGGGLGLQGCTGRWVGAAGLQRGMDWGYGATQGVGWAAGLHRIVGWGFTGRWAGAAQGGGLGLQGLSSRPLTSSSRRAVHRPLIFLSASYGVEERDSNTFQMLLFFPFYNWKQKYSMAFKLKVPERGDAFSSGVLTMI